ncbi:MAG: PEP/pyruvate-binding domain-containing protein [Patescibacteria group bacterium]
MKTLVLPFKKLNKNSVKQAGGKGANLGEMLRAKIPVPPGFVLLSEAFEQYLKEEDINVEIEAHLDKVNPKDINSVDRASHEIREIIRLSAMPADSQKAIREEYKRLAADWVAVRSSATAEDSKVASWAGELETYLYVNQAKLIEMVKTCWSSLFTPRAIFYRFEKKLHKQKVSVAVVIQKMIDSEVSGVAFTVHPVTKDRRQMVIEAGWGQGEAIVSGQITPDTYIIDKSNNHIIDKNISIQKNMIIQKPSGGSKTIKVPKTKASLQKISDKNILALAKLCQSIEKHYRHPQDIEWARSEGRWYVLQTRPITTL